MRRKCKATKSIDGGSCSERVPCDGVLVDDWNYATNTPLRYMENGCGEPCSFVMEQPDPIEAAFRAGFHAAARFGLIVKRRPEKLEAMKTEAWEKYIANR